ncbi:MAG: metallopeptidase family protein [Corynebacterium sp.]|nr:metallopeptidase family protein [Corynebacterium sp.]
MVNPSAQRRPARRDRRGRGLRGPLVPSDLPAYRSPSQRFDAAVLAAYAPFVEMFPAELATVDLAVDDVPRMNVSPDEVLESDQIVADGPVPLGRIIPTGVDQRGHPIRPHFVVFRAPIERRAQAEDSTDALPRILHEVLAILVANYVGVDPQVIDPTVD